MNSLLMSLMLAISPGSSPPALESCKEVDLRAPGQPLSPLKPLSQGYGRTALCGYFTYLTHLDARLASSHPNQPAKRIDIVGYAVRFAANRDLPRWLFIQHSSDPLSLRFGRWGSSVCDLTKNGSEVPLCLSDPKHANDADYQARLSDAVAAMYREMDSRLGTAYPGVEQHFKKTDIQALYQVYTEKSVGFVTPISYQEFDGLLTSQPSKLYRILEALFFKKCDAPVDPKLFANLDCRNQLLLTEENGFRTQIDTLLNESQPMPIPFAYCYTVVMEGNGYKRRSPLDKECRLHWSLVIGRRKNGSRCEYLVRNSSDPYEAGPPHWQNDQGDLWMDADTLGRSAFLIQWLESTNGNRTDRGTAAARRADF